MSNDVMSFVAGWFPLLSFVLGGAMYYFWRRAWIPTILVFCIPLLVFLFTFSMSFWSWLLLYLFLCWLGCWAGHSLKAWRARARQSTR